MDLPGPVTRMAPGVGAGVPAAVRSSTLPAARLPLRVLSYVLVRLRRAGLAQSPSSLVATALATSLLTGCYTESSATGPTTASATVVAARAEAPPREPLAALEWPPMSQVLRFEDLEGAILVPATLVPATGRDTAGDFVFDTGAGFLALDLPLARRLGLADSAAPPAPVALAPRPLPRLQLGALQLDQVQPVMTVDIGVVRRVTGRPVLGLLGQSILTGRILVIDYREKTLVILASGSSRAARRVPPPSLAAALSPRAVAVPFRLEGDGKIVVRARVKGGPHAGRSPWLDLIVDTGATKTVFFRSALERALPGWIDWPALRGLSAPTLTGDARATMVRVPEVELAPFRGKAARSRMDAAVLGGELGSALSEDVGRPVAGLLGYSFLKHYRFALDFGQHVLWLDPAQGDVPDRPYEYSHPGLQLECVADTARVVAVAEGSPAAEAGIKPGDRVVAIDGEPVSGGDVVALGRRLEGPPGSVLTLTLVRGGRTWTRRLVRRQLL